MFQCSQRITGTIYVHPLPSSITSCMPHTHNQCPSLSKWFLQALGHQGLNNLLAAYEDKSAQAVCTFAYCEGPGHEPLIFQGRVTVKSILIRDPSLADARTRARLCLLEVPKTLVCQHVESILPSSTDSQRLGPDFRVRRRDIRRDGQGKEEQPFSPSARSSQAQRLAGKAGVEPSSWEQNNPHQIH